MFDVRCSIFELCGFEEAPGGRPVQTQQPCSDQNVLAEQGCVERAGRMRSGVPIQRRSGQMPVARLVVRAIAPGSFDAALFGQDILVRTRLLCLNWSPAWSFFEAAKLEHRSLNIES